MNRRPQGLKAQKTIQGFLQFKSAEGLSKNTINVYKNDPEKWLEYQGDSDVGTITHQEIRQYLSYMLTDY